MRSYKCIEILLFTLLLGLLSAEQIEENQIETLKKLLLDVKDRLGNFNSLYMNKFERDLSSTSSRLSGIESTLRNVADRAIAWDNIQNHMAVWTDQTRIMEKKMDMLNRCHVKQDAWESKLVAVDALNHKLNALDNKINAMTRLEFKVEQISERVEEMNSKVNFLRARASPKPEEAGISLLAKRGLVSYLSTLEDKLDNIAKKVERKDNQFTYKHPKAYANRAEIRWPVTSLHENSHNIHRKKPESVNQCLLSAHDSKILEDVNAKVDIIFDRSLNPDYEYDSFVGHLKRQAPKSEYETAPEEIFAKFWKSLFSPFKKLNRRFRTLESQLTNIQGSCLNYTKPPANDCSKLSIGKILDTKLERLEEILSQDIMETKNTVTYQSSRMDKLSQAVHKVVYTNDKLHQNWNQQLETQQTTLQTRLKELKDLITGSCPPRDEQSETTSFIPKTTAPKTIPTKEPIKPRRQDALNQRSARCLPKYSPLWKIPHLSRGMSICPEGLKNAHRRHDHRLQGHLNRLNKKFLRKQNNVMRYRRNHVRKREISHDSAGNSLQWDDCSTLKGSSGVQKIGYEEDLNEDGRDFFTRYCDQETAGGGWTLIQRRGGAENPRENFNRTWSHYKNGFGELAKEFWFGNDYIHRLTSRENMSIRFDLWDFEGNYAYAEYMNFRVASEAKSYQLEVSGYRGNASDSFSAHNGYKFSTFDNDNDEAPSCCPCANAYGGGWWFYSCFESNLNGVYHSDPTDNEYYQGIIWELWLGDYSLKAVEIKIRPRNHLEFSFPKPIPTDSNKTFTKSLP